MLDNNGKIKTSSSHNRAIIPYKIYTGSDGNIKPIHILRILFPKATKEKLAATEMRALS